MTCNKAHIGGLLEEEREGAEKEAGGMRAKGNQRRQQDLPMSLEGQSGKFCIELLPNRKINKKLNTVLLRFRKVLKQEQQIKAEKNKPIPILELGNYPLRTWDIKCTGGKYRLCNLNIF